MGAGRAPRSKRRSSCRRRQHASRSRKERPIFSQQIVNGLMLGSIYAMVGVALTLSIGVLRFLNFSIPALFMLGGMVTWALIHAGVPWPLAVLARWRSGAAVSLVVERFTWRWMRGAGVRSAGQFDGVLDPVREPRRGELGFRVSKPLPRLFGASADWRVGNLVVSIPQLAGLADFDRHDRRACRCCSSRPDSAGRCAPSPRIPIPRFCSASMSARIVPLVFVISGVFAALAGVLFALNYRQVHPFMGEALGLKGISAMVVGGMGNVWGAIAGGLIIGLVEALSIRFFRRRFRRHRRSMGCCCSFSSCGRPACSAARSAGARA